MLAKDRHALPDTQQRPVSMLRRWSLTLAWVPIAIATLGGELLRSQGPLGAPVTAPASPGHRMYSPWGGDTLLVDNTGAVVHTWPRGPRNVNGLYLGDDGSLWRATRVPGSPPVFGGAQGGLQRVALDGSIRWEYTLASTTQWSHHDIALLPNGNVLMIAWDLMTRTEAIAAGRDPALLSTPQWLPDSIVEVQPTGPTAGAIVWEWHFMDHVVQDFDPAMANFGEVDEHPELLDINFPPEDAQSGEWNHCNALDYDPVRDLIMLNSPFQGEFYIIDHSTTTAEAASHAGGTYGRGGDILYRWGNPEAYRAGTGYDQKLFFQHGAHWVPPGLPGAGNVLIFNNEAGTLQGAQFSSVIELEFPDSFAHVTGEAYGPETLFWSYTHPTTGTFYSAGLSNAERLPNGNTLVCSGGQGWLFEISRTGEIVWEHRPSPQPLMFRTAYYERYLWSDQESTSATGVTNVAFDLIAGTAQTGQAYFLLGSASGTAPGVPLGALELPLIPDAYTRWTFTGASVLPGFAGTLAPLGRANAVLTLPALPLLKGRTLHHAYLVLDTKTLQTVQVSNSVPLALTP
ncbi:MAG: aryl-sulfate sulfotransferase [Planctomycetota bacterium]